MSTNLRDDQAVALFASLRASVEAVMAQCDGLLTQIDFAMRSYSNKAAAITCPVCRSEDLANADTQAGRARVCNQCTHSFSIEDEPQEINPS